jgi:acyl carrier protein
MDSTADIEQFILAELAQGRGISAIAPSDNLLTKGIVDSHGVMELVAYLEQRYEISVEDADLTPENFETLTSIQAFVERKQDGHS